MTQQLQSIVTFTNIPVGVTSLPHLLNVRDVAVVPDILLCVTAGSIEATADDTNVTITNLGAGAIDVQVYALHDHSIQRAYGAVANKNLTPQPFVVIAAPSSGGGGVTGIQAFTYVCTGAEGTNFTVTLPAPRADADYVVVPGLAGVNTTYAIDINDALRTVNDFNVDTSAPVIAGDQIDFVVMQRS